MSDKRGSAVFGYYLNLLLTTFLLFSCLLFSPANSLASGFDFYSPGGSVSIDAITPDSGTPDDPVDITIEGSGYTTESISGIMPGGPILAGRASSPLANYFGIEVSGNYAYVAGQDEGLIIFDISDPRRPVQSARLSTLGRTYKVFLDGNRAYIADGSYGMRLVDITNPANPVLISHFYSADTVFDITASSAYAYLAEWNSGLEIVDMSDPANPVRASLLDTPGEAMGLFIKGDLAYIADGANGLVIADISDKHKPVILGRAATRDSAHDVTVIEEVAYVADGYAGLQIVDVSDPAHPILIAGHDTQGKSYEVRVRNGIAYIADWISGIQIFDVSDPANPELLSNYNTGGTTFGISINGSDANLAYLASGPAGLEIINIGYHHLPTLIGTNKDAGHILWIAKTGEYIYLLNRDGQLSVLNNSYSILTRMETLSSPADMLISENHLFIASTTGLIEIYDISIPDTPLHTGTYNSTATIKSISINATTMYTANGTEGITLLNISDPASPSLIRRYDTDGIAYSVFASGNTAYVADGSNGLNILDLSGTDLRVLGSFTPGGTAKTVLISGSTAYLAMEEDGLAIIDITDPAHPALIRQWDTPSTLNSILIDGGRLFAVDGFSGIIEFDITNPRTPQFKKLYNTRGTAKEAVIAGDDILVADTEEGLAIIRTIGNLSHTQYSSPSSLRSTVPQGLPLGRYHIYSYTENPELNSHLKANAFIVLDGMIAISPSVADFGTVVPGLVADMEILLENKGNFNLSVTSISVSPELFSIFPGMPDLPLEIPGGGTHSLSLRFAPTTPGAISGDLTITTDDYLHPASSILLKGTGAKAVIEISESSLNFSTVKLGETAERELKISNTGAAPLLISEISANGGFQLGGAHPTSLNPGETIIISISFQPSGEGNYNGLLTIRSNAPDSPELLVPISGNSLNLSPVISISPASIDFGRTRLGSISQVVLGISNNGTAPLIINGITTDNPDFIPPVITSPVTLNPGQHLGFYVKFIPSEPGEATGELTISSNDPVNGLVKIQKKGEGYEDLLVTDVAPNLIHSSENREIEIFGTGFEKGALLGLIQGNTGFLSRYGIPGRSTGIAISGNLAYIAQWSLGLLVLDISDPRFPRKTASVDIPGGMAANVALSETFIYVITNNGNLTIIDRNSLNVISETSIAKAGKAVHVDGDFAYVSLGDEGVAVVDISNPQAPYLISRINTAGDAYHLAKASDYLFVADWSNGLAIINIADKSAPFIVNTLPTRGYANGVFVDGETVYIADGPNGVTIVNAAVPEDARIIGIFNTEDWSGNLAIVDGRLYVASSSRLYVLDVSKPSLPKLVTSYKTIGSANALLVRDGIIYVLEEGAGLITLSTYQYNTQTLFVDSHRLKVILTAGMAQGEYDVRITNPNGKHATLNNAIQVTNAKMNIISKSINFGTVGAGSVVEKTIEIKNTSIYQEDKLHIYYHVNQNTEAGVDIPDEQPLIIAAGETRSLNVRFAPTTAEELSGTILISSNDTSTDTVEIPISGEAVIPRPEIAVPGELVFDNINIGSNRNESLVIKNNGLLELIVESLEFDGNNKEAFSLIGPSLPLGIAPGGEELLVIEYTHTGGNIAGNTRIFINSNDPANNRAELDVVILSAEYGAKINVNPQAIGFGGIPVGSSIEKNVRISNRGSSELTISKLEILETVENNGEKSFSPPVKISVERFVPESSGSNFSTEETPINISPGETYNLKVTFKPQNGGVKNSTLLISSNDPEQPVTKISLKGTGQLIGNIDNSGYSWNRVDGYDIIALKLAFGSEPGDTNWNSKADLNKDQLIDGSDLNILAINFGMKR